MSDEKLPSDALVFFGATGDLAYKKIFPALQQLVKRGKLNSPVIGVAKSGWNRDQLLDLTAQAFVGNPNLDKFGGKVSDSGEGRWTVAAANDEGVPAFVLTASLFERFASRGEDEFQNKVLSAMRFGFGGHVEKK